MTETEQKAVGRYLDWHTGILLETDGKMGIYRKKSGKLIYKEKADSEELRRHITFREFLRQNPDAVKQYSRVKEQAARRFPDDIERYLEYKSPCIAELYRMCGLED